MMQVPVKPYYTISSAVLLQQHESNQPGIDESVRLNVLLDITQSQFPALFVRLGAIKNIFLFSLPVAVFSNHDILKTLLPSCYMLASLNNFSAGGETIIPVFGHTPVQLAPESVVLINDYFTGQGTKNLQLPFFNYQQEGIQHTASCCMYVPDANNPETTPPVFQPITIIAATAIGDAATFNHFTRLVKIHPDMEHVSENYIDRNTHEEEIQNWQQRALLYKSFLSLSKSVQQKEYYEVLDWYHKEYEALPLWYKRVGHLVKVMMGKRSFRSLFNDNSKKHTH